MPALRVAVANGNWSSPSTWNAGVLPGPGDTVASNNFTVTIDQNINVGSLTNAAQAIGYSNPFMTSNTAPSGIVTASNIPAPSTNDAWRAFDNSSSTWWSAGSLATPQWIAYEYPSAVAVDQYFIQGVNNGTEQGPRDWQFQGWDGVNWITLHTVIGNTSNTYTSPLIGNSTPYIRYRLYVTLGISTNLGIVNFFFYEYASLTPAVAGGGFILNSGVTVTCTGAGIVIGSVTCLTYSGTGSVTINSAISGMTANNFNGFVISSTGTVTINGNITASTTNGQTTTTINVTAAATLNVNGNITSVNGGVTNGNAIKLNAGGTLNIVGNIDSRGTQKQVVSVTNGTINITGNIIVQISGGTNNVAVEAITSTVNITGDLSLSGFVETGGNALRASNGSTINIVGTVSNSSSADAGIGVTVSISGTASFYKHVGAIIAGLRTYAFISTGTSNINILTGPFISHPSGIQPFYVSRMHYQRTLGSYYEFRDSSTNGALPPTANAPAIRMNSPEIGSDLPAASNVRFGTVYGAGSFTGTMRVPVPSNVRLGVAVDNTTGTAVLTANDVWNVLTTNLTTAGSIGERVKNVATVQTTGQQLAGFNI